MEHRTRSFRPARRGKIRWPEAFATSKPWESHYAHSIRGASGPDDAATPALSSGLLWFMQMQPLQPY
ncbi:hypothetical protein TsFJ059_001994 [Trichoderma semiorbis]|uniref:Uncharacterized protein n=1 Tax=Trichoderma semiorbis TaxID=1491008 RepID=A0A9P8KTJ3_9HYPO|nr:hypothetical protein TsFJ059_001994 [Trichoderma semiorbis]